MAGDWIKMRCDLFTHPKVVRISSALKADTLRTVGGLMSVWCLFDAHSVDGKLDGYTVEALDAHLRFPGFSAAMVSVGWLIESTESLELPRFDAHNGQSAKRRAQDADRKKEDRKASASEADKKRTREEKRREEVNPLAFSEFWTAYPRKDGKAAAEKAWLKINPDADLQAKMLKAVAIAVRTPEWLKDKGQFIPHASSWLNGKRWEDGGTVLAAVDGVIDPRFKGAK